jgi:hypothetical protein
VLAAAINYMKRHEEGPAGRPAGEETG